VPWDEQRRRLTSNSLPPTTLNANLTTESLDKNSSPQPLDSETATEIPISGWSDTRSTNVQTLKLTTTFSQIDNELDNSKLAYQDLETFSTLCCLNSLVVTNTAESVTGIPSVLQPPESGVDGSHDVTEISGIVLYLAKSSAPPIASLHITPTSDWVFESSHAHAPAPYLNEGTSQEMQYGESAAKAKNVGNSIARDPKLSRDCVRYSQGLMSSQTVQERPEASNIGSIRPTPITISSPPYPTSAESITTATGREPNIDNTRVSRPVPTHTLVLVFGYISGLSLLFGMIFFAHRFCIKRAFSPRRETDSKKAVCVATVSENPEVSRFSAYS
jgi:hypothetical protein